MRPVSRRQFPRVDQRFPLRFRPLPVRNAAAYEGGAEDLSCGGVRFRCAEGLRPRSGVIVELHVPGADPVSSLGRVAWVKELAETGGFEIGLRFEDQSTAARMAIQKHLRRLPVKENP